MKGVNVTVEFELADGRTLRCEYVRYDTPAKLTGHPDSWDEGETEYEDPEYRLDGKPIRYENLPQGLDKIAEAMFLSGIDEDPRFTYKEEY